MQIDELLATFFSKSSSKAEDASRHAKSAHEAFKRELDGLEGVQVRIAVIGRSGVGKSSLINALYGEKVAQTGATETTEEPEEHSVGGLTLVDLPGCGTVRFPADTYVDKQNLAQYDAFVLVVAKRIYEDDLNLMAEIANRLKKNVHVVRSMVDQDVENAKRDGKTQAQLVATLRLDLAKHFPGHRTTWLVSSVFPRRFDFAAFEDALALELTDRKRDRFVFAAQAYTDEQLAKKREMASRYVKMFAGLAAANGFNPIPGADIAADMAIILNMNIWVLKCYKLDAPTLERVYGKNPTAVPSKASLVMKRMLAYGTREFVKAALGKQITRMTGMELAKWVPVVGHLASAGLGFGLVHWMGQETITTCEEAVREIIFSQLDSDAAASDGDLS